MGRATNNGEVGPHWGARASKDVKLHKRGNKLDAYNTIRNEFGSTLAPPFMTHQSTICLGHLGA